MKKSSKNKFFVTTAIAYPNAAPHLGHALEIVQADCYARFNRILGKDVFFQTGTDEHGIKNWQTAKKQGKEIREFLDSNVKIFKELYEKLDISYDNFIRTSDKEKHYPGASLLWEKLVESGDIYKKNYNGLYCSGCEAFKTEKELVQGRCPDHPNREIENVTEENYFFKLSKYKDKVIELIESDEYKVIPKTRKNEILSWLKDAKDISFSRPKSSLPWGIQVPGDDSQVMYVWCDALSNYITGAGYGTDNKCFERKWPCDAHMIGKDILRFHAAFWPAMLLSAGINLPRRLFVHGFVLSNGAKMSKSVGNVVEPFSEIEKFGVSEFRYYLLSSMPIDADGDYSREQFIERVNTELVGNLSNFCYRTISFTNKNYDSEIKDVDKSIFNSVYEIVERIKENYENFNFRKATEEIMALSALGNKYFQDNEPWKLIKEDRDAVLKILGTCINIVKILSIVLKPVMPKFSSKISKQINVYDLKWDDIYNDLINHKINKAEIVFKKKMTEEINNADIEEKEMFPLNLKAAKVLSAENHPDADKLLVLQVDLGTEKRQIVAGLRGHYEPEEFVGNTIIIVSNLKYAKLRGLESQGMLLAAENEGKVGFLTSSDAKPGESICVEGFENNTKEISFDDFLKVKLRAVSGRVLFDSKELSVNGKPITTDKVSDGNVR